MEALEEGRRPRNRLTEPGGFLELEPSLGTLIIPDLHGRRHFLGNLLKWRPWQEETVEELLEKKRVQLVSLGDVMHSEARGRERWLRAYAEFEGGYGRHKNMDEEMAEGLAAAEALLILQNRFPQSVHVLKGNHENITNREGRGDHPFAKFADEGAMVSAWMSRFYSPEILYWFSRWEDGLPFFARGGSFLLSHSRPRRTYSRDELVEAADLPDVAEGLTWTRAAGAEEKAPAAMVNNFLPGGRGWYVTGHRPISGAFLCDEPPLVEFHDPQGYNVARFSGGGAMADLDKDMVILEELVEDSLDE